MKIWVYKRECEILDLVYHDGSFSDKYNAQKTPIGICIYIDPEDSSRREMISLEAISTGLQWGLYRDANDGVNGFSSITLVDSTNYNVFNTPLQDTNSPGISGNISDANFRDEKTEDGFKIFDTNVAVGDVGFMRLTVDFSYRSKTWNAGEYLSRSLYNTLVLMNHRNKICQDSSVNLQLPSVTSSMTEMESLNSLMDDIVKKNDNQAKYRQYYYPAPSMCHAYEPSVSFGLTLDEKFKAGNWALPTMGTMARFSWYYIKALAGESEGSQLKEWIDLEIFPKIAFTWLWTITEWDGNTVWIINPTNGQLSYGNNKYSATPFFAVATF